MAITVYSQRFERELDIEQLLSLLGYNNELDINIKIKKLSKQETNEIYNDLICPICNSKGGSIVKASPSTQAHFRFNTHNDFCDYNDSKDNKSQKGKSVDFGIERSSETKIIRELVAKGIEQKIISQDLIGEMRRYFYNTKIQNKYTMEISTKALNWCKNIKELKPFISINIKRLKFNPIYAQLPDFSWELAAKSLFLQDNIDLIELANNYSFKFDKKLYDKTNEKIQDTQGRDVFDVSKLEIQYKNTITFTQFIRFNLLSKSNKNPNYLIDSDIVLAFAALLLFAVGWNIESAILNLVKIVQSPNPTDINYGNVIGLNPFYDFEVWANITKVREFYSKYNPDDIDYKTQIELIEIRLKKEYELWKSSNK
jgi:hypothetical protein